MASDPMQLDVPSQLTCIDGIHSSIESDSTSSVPNRRSIHAAKNAPNSKNAYATRVRNDSGSTAR